MPLAEDAFAQSNSGGFNATGTQTVTLGTGVAAGSSVVIRMFTYGGGSMNTPSGFVRDSSAAATTQKGYVFRRGPVEGLVAGESSWNVSVTTAQPVAWWVDEIAGLDTDASPLDATSAWTTATAATASTGTSGTTTTYDGVILALHGARDAASGTGPTWSGHTNSFTEQGESAQAISGGASSVGMSVSRRFVQSLGAFESTATHSLSPATAVVGATMVVYSAAGAKRAANLVAHAGFEQGTAAGITTGLAFNLPFDTAAGSPAIVATTPRTGNYCLELSSSAAAEYLQWNADTIGTTRSRLVVRVSVRFPTSLPAGDVDLVMVGGTDNHLIRYRSASQQLGAQVGTGTEQLSGATVAADTWYDLDLLSMTSTTAAATVDWRLDGVDQTRAVGPAASGSTLSGVFFGWTTAATATVRYDDAAVSDIAGNYPLGDIKVVLLKVDPAGTVTVSGSTTNFGVMTANGTVGAWNATSARDAVDEVPPTIGASADGAVAVTASATDYIEFPMQAYDASGTASIRAVRILLPMWAASATAATCRVLGYDGTAATTLFAEADPNADNSTTTPAWIAKRFQPSGGWTQAKLDALTVRFGSNDATPDIGPHAVYAEVALQLAPIITLFGAPNADLRVEQALDPVTQGIVGLIGYTPVDQAATLVYEVDGVEQAPVDLAAGTDGLLIPLDAPDMPTISRVTLYPAEPA